MSGDWDDEYSSPMKEAAVSMHEMYLTLREAGFSRRDGLELIAKMLITGIAEAAAVEDDENDDD
jgi:hypothetical protein